MATNRTAAGWSRVQPLAIAVWLTIAAWPATGGCGSEPTTGGDNVEVGATMGLPPRFAIEALRLPGAGGLVLAEGRHGIELTLGEYNVRVDEVPLPADSDTVAACWATLERLVAHKVCAAEGRLRGYTATDARNLREEERQIARQVLEQAMLSAQLTPDDEAVTFLREHPEMFPDLTEASLAEPALLLHVKFTMHNQRWRQVMDQWLTREEVVVHRDRFAALLRERGLAAIPTPSHGGG